MQQAKSTREALASIQETIDAAIAEDGELAGWLRRARRLGELVVRRGDEDYLLDLSKLKSN